MMNPANQEMVNEFLLNLKLMNRSKITVQHYRNYLEHFFTGRNEAYSSVTPQDIQQWFSIHGSNLKETSISMRLSILSSFFTFCVQEGHIEKSPIKSRWYPRLPKPIPKYLEKEEIAKTRQQSERFSLRNQVMFEFLLSSGCCRVAELYGLDIDLENRSANVVGKGGKIRQIHFSVKCAVLLEKHLESSEKGTVALFVTPTGKRLGIRRIQIILNNIGNKAELQASLHPHRLRHTFATELLTKGADLSFIGDELGHTDISTTQIYARLPKQEIISLYRKYMG